MSAAVVVGASGRPLSLRRIAVLLAIVLSTSPALAVRMKTWTERPVDLYRGDAEGVAIDTLGRLTPVPRLVQTAEPGAFSEAVYVWSMTSDSTGNLYLGTGPDGAILKVTSAGKPSVFFSAAEPMVTALTFLPGGGLLAGTAPGGTIYKIGPDGKGEVWCETEEQYVWSLATDEGGDVFAGTGDEGKILRIDRSGKAKEFFDSDEAHVVSLQLLPDGGLLAGSAGGGFVFRVDREGHARVLHNDELVEVKRVVQAPDGSFYAALLAPPEAEVRPPAVRIQLPGGGDVGASGDRLGELQERPAATLEGIIEGLPAYGEERGKRLRGRVVRVDPAGAVTEVWRSTTEAPLCLAIDGAGHPVFGVGEPARLYRVESDGEVALVGTLREGQITALQLAGGSIAAATSNSAMVYRPEKERREAATFTSRPFDAGAVARWGLVAWRAQGSSGPVELYTRTGNSASPDETWSAWSPALTRAEGSAIPNPPGRYAQWRVRFATGASGTTVSGVSLTYMTINRPPAMREYRLDAPFPAATGKATFRFSTFDPDGDNVTTEIQYRSLGADVWTLASRSEPPQSSADPGSDEEATWRDGKIVWDTAGIAEGEYEIRALASDRGVNLASEGAEKVVEPIVRLAIDRSPPAMSPRWIRSEVLEVRVTDAYSPVVRLELVREGRVLFLALPTDGVADSKDETFRVTLAEIGAGAQGAQSLRAVDAAGNSTEQTIPAP